MDVEYLEDGDLAIYNGYKFRKDKKTGYYLSSKNIGSSRIRLHVYIWECEKGKIPKGYSVHHIDEDKSHNDIGNYVLMTNSRHARLHSEEYAENNYCRIIENLKNNAGPKAKKWHSSDAGREWHRAHYNKVKERFISERKYKCENCGKIFLSSQVKSKFCSNKCKAAARRNAGVDNVTKVCIDCGGKYIANKYQRTKYCSICKSKKHTENRDF